MEKKNLWIARDKDGCLFIYKGKPEIVKECNAMFLGDCIVAKINKNLYPEVTWENSPQELIVKN